MFKRIDHVEITTGKLEETLAFYTDVLGFKIKERNKMNRPPLQEILFLTLGDTMLELLAVQDPAAPSTQTWQTGYGGGVWLALGPFRMDLAVAHGRGASTRVNFAAGFEF